MAKDLVLNVIMKATDKASAAFARARAASHSLAGSLAEQQSQLKRLQAAQKQLHTHGSLKAVLRDTGGAIQANRARLSALTADIAKSGQATRAQRAELGRLAAEHTKLTDRQSRQRRETAALGRELRKMGIDAASGGAAQKQLRERIDATAKSVSAQRAALERHGAAQAKVARAGVVAAGAAGASAYLGHKALRAGQGIAHSAAAAMSEEDAMAGIIRQVDTLKNKDGSLNAAAIADMRAEIAKLSGELPMSTLEIMAMYQAGAKMGIARDELAGYTAEAVKAANAFESDDPAKLAEELGRIRQNFKLSREQASELVNVMNYLDDNALVSGDQLISYMNEVSGSMGLAKIGDKHVAALGSALISAGTDAGTAAKAVGSLFTRLSSAPNTAPVRKGLAKIGLDAHEIQKGMVTDAQGTLEKIINAVKQIPKEQQAGVLKDLAGGQYNRVFAQLISNTEQWGEQIRLATDPAALGSLDREFAVRMGNMSSKWQIFKNKLFNTESGFGRGMFEGLEWGMGVLSRLMDLYNNWAAANPAAAAALAKTVLAVVAVMGAVAGLAAVLAGVLVPLAVMRASLFAFAGGGAKAAAVLKMIGSGLSWLRAVLMANPIGIAIGLIGLALYLLWRNWDTVKAALIAGWRWISRAFAVNPIVAALGLALEHIKKIGISWEGLKAAAASVWAAIKNTIVGNIQGILGWVSKAIDKFKDFFGIASKPVPAAASPVPAGVRTLEAAAPGRSAVAPAAGGRLGIGGGVRPALPGALPVPARGFAARPTLVGGDTVSVHVHAAPGMSEGGIAQKIKHMLDERAAAKRRRANSSYFDKD